MVLRRRRAAVAFLTSFITVLSLVLLPTGSVSAATLPTPAAPANLDYPYLDALHFQPPLNNGPTGDPRQADTTLLDSVDVLYCKVTATDCTPIGEANSVLPGVDLLLQLGTDYTTAFSGTLHGVRGGDVVRITVRVAGLALGSTQLTANTLALLPSSTQFSPLVPLTVRFRIDRNPVIRTRYLHAHGESATQIANVLISEFGLDDVHQVLVLFNELRVGDLVLPPATAAPLAPANAAPLAPTLTCLPGPVNPNQTFDPTQVTCALTSALNAGDSLTQAASALAKGTGMSSAGPWLPPAIVSGLADQSNIANVLPTQIYAALTQGGVLAPCVRTTDPTVLGACQQVVNAFAGGLKLDNSYLYGAPDIVGLLLQIGFQPGDTTALYSLLTNAVDASNPPKLRFSPADVLSAFWKNNITISVLDSLKLLAGVPPSCTGSLAADAVKTVKDTFSGGTISRPDLVTEPNMAQAALQVLCFPTTDLVNAMTSVYGDAKPVASLQSAAQSLVKSNCAAYDPANFKPGSLPDVLSNRQGQNVLLPSDVAGLLAGSAPNGCQLALSKNAQELNLAYFAGLGPSGLTTVEQNQSIHIANALMHGIVPAPPNTDLLTALANTFQNVLNAPALECATAVGAAAPTGGNLLLQGPPGQPNGGTLAALSNSAVESAIKDQAPFSLANLKNLGDCLTKNQVPIPFPLLKITVKWSQYNGLFPAPGRYINDGLITGRTGWEPSTATDKNPPISALPPDLLAARVPNPLKVPIVGRDVPLPGAGGNGLLTLPSLAVRGPWLDSGLITQRTGFDVGQALATGKFTDMSLAPGDDFNMVVPAIPGTINFESVVYSYPNLADSPPDCIGIDGDGHEQSTAAAVVLPYTNGYQDLPNGQDDQIGQGTAQLSYTVVNNNGSQPGQPLVSTVEPIGLAAGGFSGACGLTSSFDSNGNVPVQVAFDTDPKAKGITQLTAANGGLDALGSLAETVTNPLTSVSRALDGGFGTEEILDGFSPVPLDLGLGAASAATDVAGAGNFLSLLSDAGIPTQILGGLNGTKIATLMTTGVLPS